MQIYLRLGTKDLLRGAADVEASHQDEGDEGHQWDVEVRGLGVALGRELLVAEIVAARATLPVVLIPDGEGQQDDSEFLSHVEVGHIEVDLERVQREPALELWVLEPTRK